MKYICGVDIGSSKIAACLGCFRGKELTQLWWDSIPVAGIKRGQWQDVGVLTTCLGKLFKNLKSKSGIRIQSVYLALANQNIFSRNSQAVIALAERGNKSITKTDIEKVSRQAQILGSCLEDEIIHIEPLGYTVDNENEVINPLGLYGHQLKVALYLICAKTSYINTIIEVFHRLGFKLNDITLSGLAASQAVFNPQKTKGVNLLCDIGKDITQALIFKDGRLLHYQTVACGSDDLTIGISEKLNLPYSLAEEVKISYGSIRNDGDSELSLNIRTEEQSKSRVSDREIIVKKGNAYSTLSQNSIIQAITQQSRQIAKEIRDVIQPHISAMSSPIKPTLYVSGRTACLDGFLELLEVVAGMPVKVAKIGNSSLLVPLIRHRVISGEPILNYLSCLGLVTEAMKLSHRKAPLQRSLRSRLSYIIEKSKEIYQEYF